MFLFFFVIKTLVCFYLLMSGVTLGTFNRVFDKFLELSLQPMNTENIVSLIPELSQQDSNKISEILLKSISTNCKAEFDVILDERQLTDKLNFLDELRESSSNHNQINMKAFECSPRDPKEVQKLVEIQAKREHLKKLQQMFAGLKSRNNELKNEEQRLVSEIDSSKEKLNQLLERVSVLANNR